MAVARMIVDSHGKPAHPAFAALAPLLDSGLRPLTIDRLNVLAQEADPAPSSATGAEIRFVASRQPMPGLGYEERILATGAVATRPAAAHDIMNALCWIAFPQAKRACNALHIAYANAAGNGRGTKRDALTLFDESGVIALCTDPPLAAMLHSHRWKTLFVELRGRAAAGLRFFVFGHAVYEKLLDPYPGIAGRLLIVDVPAETMAFDAATQRALADAAAAQLLPQVEAPAAIPPLPLCGVPGWDPRNEASSFYDDRAVFRPSRSTTPGNDATDSHKASAPDSSNSSVDP
jgi:hypothetical protein